ncbi:hypothetical protein, partial [Bacillus sp. WP8]|uniref:hypothetical protein n=1 Tax=Bacillus sp. WP8 TaxID=756828 RepID=UPI001C92F7BB
IPNPHFSLLPPNTIKKTSIYLPLTSLFQLLSLFPLNTPHPFSHSPIIISLIPLDFYFLINPSQNLPTPTLYPVFPPVPTIPTSFIHYPLFPPSFSL